MAYSARLIITYPVTDTLNDAVNLGSLQAEIAAMNPALGYPVVEAASTGTTIHLTFDGRLTDAELTALSAVVAAHTGEAYVTGAQRETVETETTSASTSWVTKATLNSGACTAGWWNVQATIEAQLSADGTGDTGELQLLVNGVQRGSAPVTTTGYRTHTFVFPVSRTAGQKVIAKLDFRKVGAGAASVLVRRARILVEPA